MMRVRLLLPTRASRRTIASVALVFSVLALQPVLLAQAGRTSDHWVGTWATAVVARAPLPPPQGQGQQQPAPPPPLNFNNQTLRQIVHTSIAGERVRVVFSNAFGTAPLPVGAARVALRAKDAAIVPSSARALTFSGRPATTIPAGAALVSDPVNLTVPAFADLAIDLYLPGDTSAGSSPLTIHNGAFQTSYVSPPGDQTGAVDMPLMTTTQSWFFLARVEVMAPEEIAAVVAFGDSITDGTRSTPDTNNRWPNRLASRLAAQNMKMGVLDLGIAGNRVLTDGAGVNALARFDRDVLVQPGITHLVVLEGINDIGMARQNPLPTPAEIIAGHEQLVARARSKGLRIYVGTLTPFEGANYWTAEGEAKRGAVNEWIRGNKIYDGVIDFDAVLRDPNSPTKILPQYDSGDHLHPNDAGYQAMANSLNLEWLKAPATLTGTVSR